MSLDELDINKNILDKCIDEINVFLLYYDGFKITEETLNEFRKMKEEIDYKYSVILLHYDIMKGTLQENEKNIRYHLSLLESSLENPETIKPKSPELLKKILEKNQTKTDS
jgi:hypothetical protein